MGYTTKDHQSPFPMSSTRYKNVWCVIIANPLWWNAVTSIFDHVRSHFFVYLLKFSFPFWWLFTLGSISFSVPILDAFNFPALWLPFYFDRWFPLLTTWYSLQVFFTKFFYHHAFMLEREESQETLLKSATCQQTPVVPFPGWIPFLKFVRLDRTWYAMPSQSQQMAFLFRLFSLSAHLILLCTWLVFLFQKQKGRFTSSFEVLIFIFLLVNYKSMGGSRRFALVPLRFASRCAAVQLVSDSSGFPFWW